MVKKAFVIGSPIHHSKSPKLHGFWINKHKLDAEYQAIEVKPKDLNSFIGEVGDQGFAGGNITIPHKEMVFEAIKKVDETARLIGAANTIWIEDGDLKATNTDAYGFAANLDQQAENWDGEIAKNRTVVVLGAGGAARAVVFALVERKFKSIRIVNRTLSRAQNLAERFGSACSAHAMDELSELLGDADVLVNTTSLGMAGQEESPLPSIEALPDHALVTDIVYTPLITPLLAQAQKQGLKTVDGLGMLLHQGVPGFEKWFGIRPQVTNELRNHLLGPS